MKETFIVPKVFILRNSALYHLKAHDLPFFHAKFQSSGANGLATTLVQVKKSHDKLEKILNPKIFQRKPKFFQLLKNFEKCKKKDTFTSILDKSSYFYSICMKSEQFLLEKLLKNDVFWGKSCQIWKSCGNQTAGGSALKFCMKKL